MPKRCHNCKSEEHLIEDCPTLPEEKRRSKGMGADHSSTEAGDDESDGGNIGPKKDQQRPRKTNKKSSSTNRRNFGNAGQKISSKNGN